MAVPPADGCTRLHSKPVMSLKRLAGVLGLLVLAGLALPLRAEEAAGIARVTTQPPRRGSLPEIVTAYGMAAPAQKADWPSACSRTGGWRRSW